MHAGDEALDHEPRAHVEMREAGDDLRVEEGAAFGAAAGDAALRLRPGARAGEGGAHEHSVWRGRRADLPRTGAALMQAPARPRR